MLRIMIAVDGSEPSLDAVRHGVRLVRQGLQATLVLAHVQQEATFYELATQDPDLIARASVSAGRHLMEPAVALIEAAGVRYETEVGLGETAPTLADMAERNGCDMIIIGALGQGGPQHRHCPKRQHPGGIGSSRGALAHGPANEQPRQGGQAGSGRP